MGPKDFFEMACNILKVLRMFKIIYSNKRFVVWIAFVIFSLCHNCFAKSHATTDPIHNNRKLSINISFYDAASKGDLERVQSALNQGSNIEWRTSDNNKTTALWIASQNGHLQVVEYLLDSDAKVDIPNASTGATGLCMASQKGYPDVVKVLLEKGADANVKPVNGISPLIIAS